jgi:hypothetical protein
VVAAAVVVPWTVRNSIRLGEAERRLAGGLAEALPRFVPVTMYGPLNLALANHAGADGSFSAALLASSGDSAQLQLTNPEHLRFLLHGNRMAAAWIGAHPGDFVRLVGKKWALYAGTLRLGWTQWNAPGGLTGLRRPVDLFVPESAAAFALWVPALLAGALLLVRGEAQQRRWLVLTLLLTAVSLVVVAFFFGYARLGLLLLPLWMGVAATALVGLGRWLFARLPEDQRGLFRGPRGRSLAATLVLLLVTLEVAGTVRGHRFEATGTTLPGSNRLDRDQPIHFRPLPAE